MTRIPCGHYWFWAIDGRPDACDNEATVEAGAQCRCDEHAWQIADDPAFSRIIHPVTPSPE